MRGRHRRSSTNNREENSQEGFSEPFQNWWVISKKQIKSYQYKGSDKSFRMILTTSEHTVQRQYWLKCLDPQKYPSCDTLPLKDSCVHNLDHRGGGRGEGKQRVSLPSQLESTYITTFPMMVNLGTATGGLNVTITSQVVVYAPAERIDRETAFFLLYL
jgi:hypothetical protein